MKKAGRILGRILIGIVIIALIAGAGGLFYFKSYLPNTVAPQSFPQINGEIKISGIDSPVDIYRDKMGVPHIYATTEHDLFFAQGYVHAQDRFWQMDFWRHEGAGTLSEMFGKGQVDTDKFLRTVGWRNVAEQEYASLNPGAKAILDAYTEGVNAYLKDHNGNTVSLEYAILKLLTPDYKIAPWTPVNSLTWGKAMAWDLGGKMEDEITRAVLLKTLTPQQLNDLYPDYPADYPVIVPQIGENVSLPANQAFATLDSAISSIDFKSLSTQFAAVDNLLGPRGGDIGSNSWVISGKLTSTGKPFLANDMHLANQMPSIWYEMDLHCQPKSDACPYEMSGFTFAGVPGVVAGHNDRIAWGYTNLGPDVQDLFIEKVNPDNPNQYEVDGKWVDFQTRQETINVAGGKSVTITVRISRHGPIISDTYGPVMDQVDPKANPEATPFKDKVGVELPTNYVIALAWTALNPSTPFEAIWGFDRAQNWDDFRAAARNFHVPAQNLIYADVDGNIGYQTPGDIPIRKKGDGMLPVPGWNSEYDWTGYIPFDELPYVYNPQSGYVVTANNQASPRDYPYLITKDWNYGQRAARITDMIQNAPGKIDAAYIQTMHGDSKSLNAETLIPILLSLKMDAGAAAVRDQYLANWDFQERADSKSAAVFESFWANLLNDTFNDDLPKEYWPDGSSRWVAIVRNLVQQPNSSWWDDKNSEQVVETRDNVFVNAFEETVTQLQKDYGKDLAKLPAWGELHTVTFPNLTLGESGVSLIEGLFNRGPFPVGGGRNAVDANSWTVGNTFAVDEVPSEREIVDLSNLNKSLAIHTTGESGHAYNKHYDDMIPLWANIKYYPMWWEQDSIIKDAEGHLVLKP